MNIPKLQKTTKDNPASFLGRYWEYCNCSLAFLRDSGSFKSLQNKNKLILAYVNRASLLDNISKWFYPLSDYSFEVIRDYDQSKQVFRDGDDIDFDYLSVSEQMDFLQRRLQAGASLFCMPVLMREVK